ncbi:MAG: polysaccharide deacetylase family protein, partial [Verrucomicrobiota bacterium]
MRAQSTFSPSIPAAAGILIAFTLSSCDKVWELGKELQPPEEAPPELVENSAPVSIPNAPDYTPPEETQPVKPEPPKPKFNADAQVSILGYHDFTESGSGTDMKINIDKFRQQMQTLKDSEVPVITMRDFIAWKKGEKEIPDKCVVITMDDGWVGVYELAYPILKEFGYPFSIYLYKNYVNTGGRSLSYDQVREMMANGCEVGSHSVSHDFMARTRGRTPDQYEAWLREELGESLRFLREHFGEDVLPVFVYPYGNYNDQVVELAEEYGYEIGLTVAPKKADHSLDDLRVGRYIIHGDNEINITAALRYRGGESLAGGQGLLNSGGSSTGGGTEEKPEPLVRTTPEAGATVSDRLPLIEVNISKLKGVSSDSITMRVSGLGRVPYEYDAANGIISYQM